MNNIELIAESFKYAGEIVVSAAEILRIMATEEKATNFSEEEIQSIEMAVAQAFDGIEYPTRDINRTSPETEDTVALNTSPSFKHTRVDVSVKTPSKRLSDDFHFIGRTNSEANQRINLPEEENIAFLQKKPYLEGSSQALAKSTPASIALKPKTPVIYLPAHPNREMIHSPIKNQPTKNLAREDVQAPGLHQVRPQVLTNFRFEYGGSIRLQEGQSIQFRANRPIILPTGEVVRANAVAAASGPTSSQAGRLTSPQNVSVVHQRFVRPTTANPGARRPHSEI